MKKKDKINTKKIQMRNKNLERLQRKQGLDFYILENKKKQEELKTQKRIINNQLSILDLDLAELNTEKRGLKLENNIIFQNIKED